jgi:[acyl-carrier-protein] S-malonyltransferase
MGRDLCATEPLMRETYAEASDVLGYDLEQLCAEAPAERLARTDITQPALLATSVGIFRVLRHEGLLFSAALGHSLGEYSALVATGALSFRDGLWLVRRRGEEMQAAAAAAASPGGMAAVIGLDEDVVETLCAEIAGVWPANFNSPGQVVVSGTGQGLESFGDRAKEAGARRIIALPVSGAFHSPLMEPALGPLEEELRRADWQVPDPPFYSACSLEFETGQFVDLLLRQLVSPVRFTQAVKALGAAGYDAFLEVGPGSVLGGLVRRIAPEATVSHVSDVETLTSLRKDRCNLEAP